MSSDDLPVAVPALPDRVRTVRWGFYAARAAIVVVLLAVAAFLPVGQGAFDRLRYHEGEIARERVVAPSDFKILKDEVSLRREQEEAALAVPPVFVVDQRAHTEALERWSAFQERALAIVSDPSVATHQRADKLKLLGVALDGDAAEALASSGRVRRALTEVEAGAGQRILEIGCGWGALAEMAARDFGAHLSGVTLSTEQLDFANQRMQRLGISEKVDLRLQDYRDIDDGPFDAICSIEMLEAVGQEYWPTYFQTLARLLKPGGRACVQSIVIADGLFERYLRNTDFIQQYIFPGGCLPSPSALRARAQAAGLEVVNELAFGHEYAETLKRWRTAFLERRVDVLAGGFDQRFMHIWEFYLAYCEAGFAEDNLDVLQVTLRKPA